MAKLVYNNAKKGSTSHTLLELNYEYHPRMSYEENIDFCSKFKSIDKLLAELWELMTVCRKNLYYAQEL